jgi:hypothetical protein
MEVKPAEAESGLLCNSDWSADIGGNGPSGPSAGCFIVPEDGDNCPLRVKGSSARALHSRLTQCLYTIDSGHPLVAGFTMLNRVMSVLADICVSWLSVHHCSVSMTAQLRPGAV